MPEITPSRYLVQAGWQDVPHLSEKAKTELLASTPQHLRKARTQGLPFMGAGAIYPFEEETILCDPFALPLFWPRAFGFDVGWNRTAAVWGALDRDSDILYLYSTYYRGQAEPSVHKQAIRARGNWIPGAIDPASRGRSQADGKALFSQYTTGESKLPLTLADNAVEAGIQEVYDRLSLGRLKVFRTLADWLMEYRLYRRDENGKIVKKLDHLMDGTRYLVMTGIRHAKVEPVALRRDTTSAHADPTAGY